MRFIFILLCITTFISTSCSSDDDRIDLDTIGKTFEVAKINFTSDNNISRIGVTIPNTIEVFESDVALVYVRDPQISSNERADAWEPLPRTFFFDNNGYAQFRYNFIFDADRNIFDIEIILESDNFAALDTTFTQNQVFRVVIVPSSFPKNSKVDLSDINAVKSALKLDF
ncbi:hypothetical protein [Aquimarina longa]|uniref:hypothetical protein n=1 Tax=Aquimarina longa TaxID=1080221 RepID=UPI00078215DB|nr:hypothetical protein [Aquimarina longa]